MASLTSKVKYPCELKTTYIAAKPLPFLALRGVYKFLKG